MHSVIPMNSLEDISIRNQDRAWEIIKNTDIVNIWESIHAEIRLVGSLKMGLMMKHRDIDFHIYSSPLNILDSFAAMAKLAENPAIKRIEYTNLINTDEKCIEWHAWYQDHDNELWQIDMIHILKGSFYDGYFENIADRIITLLTPKNKEIILNLKYETPDHEKIPGIAYYQAVIRDKIKTYTDFMQWYKEHPVTGIVEWIP